MHSAADPEKQFRAQQVFSKCLEQSRIVLSTQVIQEFHVAGSRKLALPRQSLRVLTLALLELPLIQVSPSHIKTALSIQEEYGISFWDALILAAAQSSGAQILYTEDLNDGRQYGSLRVENPFRDIKAGRS